MPTTTDAFWLAEHWPGWISVTCLPRQTPDALLIGAIITTGLSAILLLCFVLAISTRVGRITTVVVPTACVGVVLWAVAFVFLHSSVFRVVPPEIQNGSIMEKGEFIVSLDSPLIRAIFLGVFWAAALLIPLALLISRRAQVRKYRARSKVQPNDFSQDWRDRLMACLSSPSVTQPLNQPAWKYYPKVLARCFGFICIPKVYIVLSIGVVLATCTGLQDAHGRDILIWLGIELLAIAIVPLAVPLLLVAPFRRLMRASRMRYANGNPKQKIGRAKNPPILFLRSFAFDEDSSWAPRWREVFICTIINSISLFLLKIGIIVPVALASSEMSLILACSRFAPVLAFGRPGEFVPPPGAIRFYVTHETWQEKMKAIVPLCQLVIWVTGHTDSLRWEIRHLVDTIPPARLLVWPHIRAGKRRRRQREAEWAQFVHAYQDVFPKPLPLTLNSARFIAFDDDWSPLAIPSGRYRPSWWDRLGSRPSMWGLESFLIERLIGPFRGGWKLHVHPLIWAALYAAIVLLRICLRFQNVAYPNIPYAIGSLGALLFFDPMVIALVALIWAKIRRRATRWDIVFILSSILAGLYAVGDITGYRGR